MNESNHMNASLIEQLQQFTWYLFYETTFDQRKKQSQWYESERFKSLLERERSVNSKFVNFMMFLTV